MTLGVCHLAVMEFFFVFGQNQTYLLGNQVCPSMLFTVKSNLLSRGHGSFQTSFKSQSAYCDFEGTAVFPIFKSIFGALADVTGGRHGHVWNRIEPIFRNPSRNPELLHPFGLDARLRDIGVSASTRPPEGAGPGFSTPPESLRPAGSREPTATVL